MTWLLLIHGGEGVVPALLIDNYIALIYQLECDYNCFVRDEESTENVVNERDLFKLQYSWENIYRRSDIRVLSSGPETACSKTIA